MTDLITKRKVWTNDEMVWLKENYQSLTPAELQAKLGTTWPAIKSKAFKLELNRQTPVYDELAIVTDCLAKMTMKAITEKHGISNQIYYEILKKNKIEKKNNNLNGVNETEFTADYLAMTMPALESKYNVSRPTIRGKAKKLNLSRPKKFMGSPLLLDDTTITKIVNSSKTKTIREVSDEFGVAVGSVCNALSAAGVELSTEEKASRIKQGFVKKYGYENPLSDGSTRIKIRETCIEKYGSYPPNSCYGKTETTIREWLKSVTGREFKSDYTILAGKEIDMYDATSKTGIEYCGLYWHNENSPEPRDSNYHYEKYKLAQENGIKLITIFEDEWTNRQEQVKGALMSILHVNTRKLHGRKCEVKTIDKTTGNKFYDAYHIQGKANLSKHFAGLYFEDELVGVLSFGMHHRDITKHTLDRLCFKPNVSVAGGADKLFKFLVKTTGVTELISWSDNRWFCGNVYPKLGFVKDCEMKPDYSYVDINNLGKRLSKQSQKKGNTNCPEDLTEKQWSAKNGLYRIWDCGKIRWLWTKPVDNIKVCPHQN